MDVTDVTTIISNNNNDGNEYAPLVPLSCKCCGKEIF